MNLAILSHTCRCMTPSDFLKTTEVYASSGYCYSYFTGFCSKILTLSKAILNFFWCGVSWIDERSGWTTSEFTNPIVSWIKGLDAFPNTNTSQIQWKAGKVTSIKVTSFAIHVHKQTSFFLWTAVQRLYHPLLSPWNNFWFTTDVRSSYPGIEWLEPIID